MQLDKIIVRHTCDIVHHKLVGFRLFVTDRLRRQGRNMVTEDGRSRLTCLYVVQKLTVDVFYHRLDCAFRARNFSCSVVDFFVVFCFRFFQRRKMQVIFLRFFCSSNISLVFDEDQKSELDVTISNSLSLFILLSNSNLFFKSDKISIKSSIFFIISFVSISQIIPNKKENINHIFS